MKLNKNQVRCKICKTILTSEHRYDFKSCLCESVFIDGGLEYLKRGYRATSPEEAFEELSTRIDENGNEYRIKNESC